MPVPNKFAFALPLAALLMLGACNDRAETSAEVEADTVEAPAEDALAPLEDTQVAPPAPAARDFSIADRPAAVEAQAAPTRAATQSPEEAADAAAAAAADAQAAAAGLPETE